VTVTVNVRVPFPLAVLLVPLVGGAPPEPVRVELPVPLGCPPVPRAPELLHAPTTAPSTNIRRTDQRLRSQRDGAFGFSMRGSVPHTAFFDQDARDEFVRASRRAGRRWVDPAGGEQL
jgi:hypothetical protein